FLLRTYRRTGNTEALAMAETTLRAMRFGGIYDHLGSGFHRYATDAGWRVPHFEKMLYDQALLALAYTEAFQLTGDSLYRETAEGILGYMLRDLRGKEGAFLAAEDAESGGVEGGYYLWTGEEIRGILDGREREAFVRYFGIRGEGNATMAGEGSLSGENVLFRAVPEADLAREMGVTLPELVGLLRSSRAKMRAIRETRPRPARDDKILTDWNGLAIAALARGARVFRSGEYLAAAEAAADFILSTLVRPDGRLLHRYRDGEAAIDGNADDHVFLAWGLLGLYRAGLGIQYLDRAVAVADALLAHFRDREEGGFFFTPDDGEALIARQKPVHDGAIPSANSLVLALLLRLSGLTGRADYLQAAGELEEWYLREHGASPAASTCMMVSLDLATGPSADVVITGDPRAADTRALLAVLDARDEPGMTVLLRRPGGDPVLDDLAPFTAGFTAVGGKATAYLCRNHACQLPVTDPDALAKLLGSLRNPPG
ncbi:MAG: thioredoxin domain-containing protein, partial [Methanomicrobiales archaeon]|nr:thioredoxin domain-containing protein [Methanomicrobiales archaeon]